MNAFVEENLYDRLRQHWNSNRKFAVQEESIGNCKWLRQRMATKNCGFL